MATEENNTTGIGDCNLVTRGKNRLKYNPIKAERVGLTDKLTGVYSTATVVDPDYDYSKTVPTVDSKPMGTAANQDPKPAQPTDEGKGIKKVSLDPQAAKQTNGAKDEGQKPPVKLNENTYSDMKLEKKKAEEPVDTAGSKKYRLAYNPIKQGNSSLSSKVNNMTKSILEQNGTEAKVVVEERKETFPTEVAVEDKVVEEPMKGPEESERREKSNSGSKSKAISVKSKKESVKEVVEKKAPFDFDALMRKYNSIYTKVEGT